MVLMIMYNTQNHSVSELRPSSDILKTGKHNISLNLSKRPKKLGVFLLVPYDAVNRNKASIRHLSLFYFFFLTLLFLLSREYGDCSSFRNVLFSSLYNKVQKPGLQKRVRLDHVILYMVVMLKLRWWGRINWWILLIFCAQLLSLQVFPQEQILVDYLIYETGASSHETFEWNLLGLLFPACTSHPFIKLLQYYWNLEDRFQCFGNTYCLPSSG
jgi:hypothetical protein